MMSDDDDGGGEDDRREQQNQRAPERGSRGGRGGKSRAGAAGRGAGAALASTEKSAPKQSRALASLQSVNNPGTGQSMMRVFFCTHLAATHILSTASFISSAGELPVPLTSALVGNRKAATAASLTSSVAAPAAAAAAASSAPSSSSAAGAASSSALPLAGVGALGPADSQKNAKKRSDWALLKLSRESFERAKQALEHEINKHIELGGDAYPPRATAVKWVEIAVKGLKGPDNRVHVMAPSDPESERLRE
jgi:hypothetical protein